MIQQAKQKWTSLPTIGRIALIVGTIIPFGFMIIGLITAIKFFLKEK